MIARMMSRAFPLLLLTLCFNALFAQEGQSDSLRTHGPESLSNANGTHGDVILDGDTTLTTAGVVLRAKSTRPSVAAQTATSDNGSGFLIFNAANTELLRVRGDGNVGVGTAAPRSLLHLLRNASGALGPELLLENNANTVGDASALTFSANFAPRAQIRSRVESNDFVRGTIEFWTGLTSLTEKMRVTGAGHVGIGTPTPAAKLHLNGGTESFQLDTANSDGFNVRFRDLLPIAGYGRGILMEMLGNSEIKVSGMEIGRLTVPVIQSLGTPGAAPLYLNLWSQNDVVIGHSDYTNMGLRVEGRGLSQFKGPVSVAGNTTVTGNLSVSGAITGATVIGATYQDLAEWVPAKSDMTPGTVVILNPEQTNEVMPSANRYDVRVAGVVSAQPGLILGVAGASKEQIATTGRVRVKVDATSAPIRIGDLLVTSDKPGMAMRSDAIEIQGRQFHQPGTIIGKALEPLPGGEGEILVLLSLQ